MDHREDCFHLGVKALIHDGAGKLLLLQRNLKKTKEVYWDLPGGRLQRNESLEEALRREVFEETGLQNITNVRPFTVSLTNIRIPIHDSDVGLIFALYLCEVPTNSPICLSHEHVHFEWFEPVKSAELLAKNYPVERIASIWS